MSQFLYSLEDSFCSLVCKGRGGRKAQTHSFNNGITMKRVRHVISFTFNGGEKNENERMEYIRHEKQEEEKKVNKLNVKSKGKERFLSFFALFIIHDRLFPEKIPHNEVTIS
jgi:hypothetical protein